MAKVEMDLAELKQLEQKIKDLETDKQDLIDKQQQVIIYHKYFDGKVKFGPKARQKEFEINSIIHTKTLKMYNSNFDVGSPRYEYSNRIVDEFISMQDLYDNGFIEIDLKENTSKTTKDYKNLSEVINEIKFEEKEAISEQFNMALERATLAEAKLIDINDEHDKEIIKVTKIWQDTLAKTSEKYEKKLEGLKKDLIALQQEYDDFKEDKKRLTLEQQLEQLQKDAKAQTDELKKMVDSLKNRSFWKRVFNLQ